MNPRFGSRAAAVAAASFAVVLPLTACAAESAEPSATSSSTQANSGSSESASDVADVTAMPDASAEYRDGTYTVRGVYGGAPSYMTITLTLEDESITDVLVEPMPENNDTSRGYQERFAAVVPEEVIGKSVEDLEVGIIAGASGCADGFNDALSKIRAQAST